LIKIANTVSSFKGLKASFFSSPEGIMTKAEIATIICERVGLSKKESSQIVEVLLENIKDTLEKGEDVKLSGFGHFIVRSKSSRRGRNPKTGESIIIEPRKVVTFRASQLVKDKLKKQLG